MAFTSISKAAKGVFGFSPRERPIELLLDTGVVAVDKPRGPSSHEVSSFARRILGVSKTGHSGTLDPDVSGVLPIMAGSACKAAPLLLGSKKEYVCVMALEKPLAAKDVDVFFNDQRGKIYQTPPLESAVRKALRIREVYELDVLEVVENRVLFTALVQGGTYIRTIIKDFGLLSGVGARMEELRRTKAAGIGEDKCVTLQELSDFVWLWREKGDEARLRKAVTPLEEVVRLRKVVVSDHAIEGICKGADVAAGDVVGIDDAIHNAGVVGIFTLKGELVCVARALMDAGGVAGKEGKRAVFADVLRVVMPRGRLGG